jgi:hypothetical protein
MVVFPPILSNNFQRLIIFAINDTFTGKKWKEERSQKHTAREKDSLPQSRGGIKGG